MIPQTPPQKHSSFSLFTPPTPRYAPIDEPDRELHHNDDDSKHLTIGNQKQQFQAKQQRTSNNTIAKPVPAQQTQSLTPAETPVARKRGIEAINTPGSQQTGRVLFPSHTPKIGSGRTGHKHFPSITASSTISLTSASTSSSSASKQGPQSLSASSSNTKLEGMSKTRHINPNVRIISPSQAAKPAVREITIFDDAKAMKKEIDNEDPFANSNDPFDSQPISKKQKKQSSSTKEAIHHPHHPLPHEQPGMWYVFRGKKVFRPFKDGKDDDELDFKPRKLFQKELAASAGKDQDPPSPQLSQDSEEEETDHEDDPMPASLSSGGSLISPIVPQKGIRRHLFR